MFGKEKRKQKNAEKSEKVVDRGGWGWYYIQALAKRGFGRRAWREGAGILKTIQRRERNDS